MRPCQISTFLFPLLDRSYGRHEDNSQVLSGKVMIPINKNFTDSKHIIVQKNKFQWIP